jgi:membrane protease YdiL (CAAX protease family)
LSWLTWPLYLTGLSPSPILGCGPFLAAVVVLALTEGRTGVLDLLRRMVRWRVSPVWYAVALLLPAALPAPATWINVLLGAEPPTSTAWAAWPGLLPTYLLLLLIRGIGGAWEEPGWRGYALPRLMTGRTALAASLVLGVLWAAWHLPLMLAGKIH